MGGEVIFSLVHFQWMYMLFIFRWLWLRKVVFCSMHSLLLSTSVDIIHRRCSRTLIITFMISTWSFDATFVLVNIHSFFTALNSIHRAQLGIWQSCGCNMNNNICYRLKRDNAPILLLWPARNLIIAVFKKCEHWNSNLNQRFGFHCHQSSISRPLQKTEVYFEWVKRSCPLVMIGEFNPFCLFPYFKVPWLHVAITMTVGSEKHSHTLGFKVQSLCVIEKRENSAFNI